MTLADEFQQEAIHRDWESVYRSSRGQDKLNDSILARLLHCMNLAPDARLLDAGCGTGEHTHRFAQLGCRGLGIDVSEYVLTKAKAASQGLNIEFAKLGLENLSSLTPEFDIVHCRGVLMHIPQWEQALAELCRVVKRGGWLVVIDSNHLAVETWLVRLVRLLRKSESVMLRDRGGLEFHNPVADQAPLTRISNQRAIARAMKCYGVEPQLRIATEFWDANRFPQNLRGIVVAWNRAYFGLRLPARFAHGNAILGVKQ